MTVRSGSTAARARQSFWSLFRPLLLAQAISVVFILLQLPGCMSWSSHPPLVDRQRPPRGACGTQDKSHGCHCDHSSVLQTVKSSYTCSLSLQQRDSRSDATGLEEDMDERPCVGKAFDHNGVTNTRRQLLLAPLSASMVLDTVIRSSPALAVESTRAEQLPFHEQRLLATRVHENALTPPPYGMEGSDVFYPSYVLPVQHGDGKDLL